MYTPSSHLLPPEDMHPNSPVPLLYRLALTLSYTLSEKGCGLNSAAINWIKLNWHKVKPVVLSQCLAKSLCWNWERCFFSGVVACTTTQTYSSIFLFFFFLLQGRHNPLAPGNWTVGKYLFQSGICLWAMWSKKKRIPCFGRTWHFWSNWWISVERDHRSERSFFVIQTLAYLPVADWTASSAFFLGHSQQCNGRCHRVAYHPAFSMLKKRDCCTVPWLLQILQIIIFPVDINKTQTFYHTVALILRFRRHNVGWWESHVVIISPL